MVALTAAIVNLYVNDNATFQDPLQFGVTGDTSWSFTGMSFEMAVKASRDDTTPLAIFYSSSGDIVVDDAVTRVLHFNVPDTTIQTKLPPAEYVYDLVMLDASNPPIRTVLAQGYFIVEHGITP